MNRKLRVLTAADPVMDPRRKFTLRFDDELGDYLERCARENGRSLNAEIVWRLRRSRDAYKQ